MDARHIASLLTAVAACTAILRAPAQECEDYGAKHPDWILCEDWESGSIDSAVWNDISGDNTLVSSPVHGGTYALDMAHPSGSTGGYLNSIWYWTGYDQLHDHGFPHLFVRWNSSFDGGFGSSTKIAGFSVKASDLPGFWDGYVGAGYKPDGVVNGGGCRIVTSSDGSVYPGVLRFYTYHREMMLDRWSNDGMDVQCAYYGDSAPPPPGWVHTDTTEPPQDYYCSHPGTPAWDEYTALLSGYDPGTYLDDAMVEGGGPWRCIELEMQVDDPGQSNGELRFWVDDELVGEWSGLRFSEDGVQMNIHALQLTASSGSGHGEQHSYYDDIVVSTTRIACDGSGGDDDDAGDDDAGDDDAGDDDAGDDDDDDADDDQSDDDADGTQGCECAVTDRAGVDGGAVLLLLAVIIHRRRNGTRSFEFRFFTQDDS